MTNFLLYFSCFYSALILTKNAFPLDIRSAEEQALSNDNGLRRTNYLFLAAEARHNANTAKYFPSLSVDYTLSKTQTENYSRSATLGIRAELANPFAWSVETKLSKIDEELAALDQSSRRSQIIYITRKEYYEHVFYREQIEIAHKQLALLNEVAALNKSKYTRGIISLWDLERSRLELAKQKQKIDALSININESKSRLQQRIGASTLSENSSLAALPEKFNLATLPSTLAANIRMQRSALISEQSVAQIKAQYARLLPKFFIASQSSSIEQEKTSSYLAGLSWTLGSDQYHNIKAAHFESIAAQAGKNFEQDEAQREFQKARAELLIQEKSLEHQREAVAAMRKVLEGSTRIYNAGQMNLRDYYEDFRQLISEEDLYLQERLNVLNSFATLSFLIDDAELFYRGIAP